MCFEILVCRLHSKWTNLCLENVHRLMNKITSLMNIFGENTELKPAIWLIFLFSLTIYNVYMRDSTMAIRSHYAMDFTAMSTTDSWRWSSKQIDVSLSIEISWYNLRLIVIFHSIFLFSVCSVYVGLFWHTHEYTNAKSAWHITIAFVFVSLLIFS